MMDAELIRSAYNLDSTRVAIIVILIALPAVVMLIKRWIEKDMRDWQIEQMRRDQEREQLEQLLWQKYEWHGEFQQKYGDPIPPDVLNLIDAHNKDVFERGLPLQQIVSWYGKPVSLWMLNDWTKKPKRKFKLGDDGEIVEVDE